MIFRAVLPTWKEQLYGFVAFWLKAVHSNMTDWAAYLRDTTKDVWTEAPTDDTKLTQPHRSLEGLRVAVKKQRSALAGYNTTYGSDLQGYDAGARTALTGYLSSTASIGTVFNSVIANYVDGSGNLVQTRVSQAHRNQLAAAIEAELEP